MEDTPAVDGLVPERTAVEEAAGLSILRRAQERRSNQTDELDLDIPSWDGSLIGHYHVVDRNKLADDAKKILARAKGNDPNAAIESDIKFLTRATAGFSVRDPDTGEVIRLKDSGDFDIGIRELPRYLELGEDAGVETPDDVILYLFKNNGVAIGAHAMDVARWMRDPSKDPDAGPLGLRQ